MRVADCVLPFASILVSCEARRFKSRFFMFCWLYNAFTCADLSACHELIYVALFSVFNRTELCDCGCPMSSRGLIEVPVLICHALLCFVCASMWFALSWNAVVNGAVHDYAWTCAVVIDLRCGCDVSHIHVYACAYALI